MKFTQQQVSTILVSLRNLVKDYGQGHNFIPAIRLDWPDHFNDFEPLRIEQIEALCESINMDDSVEISQGDAAMLLGALDEYIEYGREEVKHATSLTDEERDEKQAGLEAVGEAMERINRQIASRSFTVILRWPDYLGSGQEQVSIHHVKASTPVMAAKRAKREHFLDHTKDNPEAAGSPEEFETLAVFEGHHEDVTGKGE